MKHTHQDLALLSESRAVKLPLHASVDTLCFACRATGHAALCPVCRHRRVQLSEPFLNMRKMPNEFAGACGGDCVRQIISRIQATKQLNCLYWVPRFKPMSLPLSILSQRHVCDVYLHPCPVPSMVASPGHATTAQKRYKQNINNAMDQAQEWDEISILSTPALCKHQSF